MNKPYRLVAFDVDGTLVGSADQKVVWELFNHSFGFQHGASGFRFEAYLENHITYSEWVDLDIRDWMLAQVTRPQMASLISQYLYVMPGADDTLAALKEEGCRLAVISGTLDILLEVLLPEQPFDEVYTNRIFFDEAGRICEWKATPYDMQGKAEALTAICDRLDIPLAQTVFVGDNINDIYAMQKAGLAIAYNAKASSVTEAADVAIDGDLRGVLGVMGLARAGG